MPRMIDVIRSSGASANVMQTAARGALHVPPQEMIEILVYLATQTKIFAERARLTLAGWDEASSLAAASDPRTPKEVLAYMVAPGNLRPRPAVRKGILGPGHPCCPEVVNRPQLPFAAVFRRGQLG